MKAVNWFGEKGVECAFVDFFVDEADAGKDGDKEDAKKEMARLSPRSLVTLT